MNRVFLVTLTALVAIPAAEAEPPTPGDLLTQADAAFYGKDAPRDPAKALPLYAKACESGLAEACGEQAEILYWGLGGVVVDKVKSRNLIKGARSGLDAACTAGSARACLRLGFAYADGVGVVQDYPKAAALDKKACDAGLGEACIYLGLFYAEGKGVDINPARAHMLYVKACQLGHAPACEMGAVKALDTQVDPAPDAKSPEG